jgi:UDP-N-acetylmuramyl pentapeptide phosphotransferase/UDP-N-acetylglucosamine-1-phosphate transferase
MTYLLIYFVLFIASVAGVKLFTSVARGKGFLDIPNHRSSHSVPTPRGGGVVFIGLWLLYLLGAYFLSTLPLSIMLSFFVPTLIISVISYCDDYMNLSAKLRFSIQALAVVLAMIFLGHERLLDFSLFTLSSVWLILPFVFISLLWSINLFNFMDGMDGFSAVEAVFVFSAGGLLVFIAGASVIAELLWALCALLLGFLVWNKPKAKIFMGDVGSASLGLVVLLSGYIAQKYAHVPIVLWFMLYGVFLFDATITLIRRLLRKERLYEAHKKHAYQRLQQAGWSHGQVLLGLITINILIFFITLCAFYLTAYTYFLLLIELILLVAIYLAIEKKKPMERNHV